MKQDITMCVYFADEYVQKVNCECYLDNRCVSLHVEGRVKALFEKEVFLRVDKRFAPVETYICVGKGKSRGIPVTINDDGRITMNSTVFSVGENIEISTCWHIAD